MSLTEDERPPNRFVVQLESGHPGFRNYLFIASEEGLRELSGALKRLADLSAGARIDFHVTERKNADSMGSLAFAKCTEEKLSELQQPSAVAKFRRGFATPFVLLPLMVAFFVVLSVGIMHCLRYAATFVAWVASNV